MRPRRGVSLLIVLVLTSAVLLLVVALTDAFLQAARSSRLAWHGERALHAADAHLLRSIESWDAASVAALRPGEVADGPSVEELGLTVHVRYARTGSGFLWYTATAEEASNSPMRAQRRVIRGVTLWWPAVPAHAAVVTHGPLHVGAGAAILGADAQPAGWDDECALDRSPVPWRAAVAPSVTIDPLAVVVGLGGSVTAPDSTWRPAFDAAWTALVPLATRVAGPSDSVLSLDPVGMACPAWLAHAARTGVPEACTREWPIVHADASRVRLTGSTPVQGILLVDGDLTLDAGVQVAGLILVRGRVTATAAPGEPGIELVGAVLVRDSAGIGSSIEGAVTVRAGRCPVRRALAAASRPFPRVVHGWSERP